MQALRADHHLKAPVAEPATLSGALERLLSSKAAPLRGQMNATVLRRKPPFARRVLRCRSMSEFGGPLVRLNGTGNRLKGLVMVKAAEPLRQLFCSVAMPILLVSV